MEDSQEKYQALVDGELENREDVNFRLARSGFMIKCMRLLKNFSLNRIYAPCLCANGA